jgi:hypothetical protein
MNKLKTILYFGFLFCFLTLCNGQTKTNQLTSKHCVYSENSSTLCKCPIQFDLKDSVKLTHLKNQFYKSITGHLYEKTIGMREIKNKLTEVIYFNGYFFQEIDPITFEALDGWYAKDKKYVYAYRPTSGGMQLSKIDNADPKTFKLLAGHYKYAKDKKFFYEEGKIIAGFSPSKTSLKLDKKKRVIEMNCKTKKYKFEVID